MHHGALQPNEVGRARRSGGGVTRGVESEGHIARRGGSSVVPDEGGLQGQRYRAAVGRPGPGAGKVWHRAQGRIVTDECHEEGESLHLSSERMYRHQRIPRLQVGARGDYDHVAVARRGGALNSEKRWRAREK